MAPLHLPLQTDARARRVVRALLADPADRRTLAAWTRPAGASLRALERLAGGEAVTTVALDLGYDSPSAFVAMFRRALGTTPGRYFAARAGR